MKTHRFSPVWTCCLTAAAAFLCLRTARSQPPTLSATRQITPGHSGAFDVTASDSSVTTYALTVIGGRGDGDYPEGKVINIDADPRPAGRVFDLWTGGGGHVADVYSNVTHVTMPSHSLIVTATYRDAGSSGIADLDAIRADVIAHPATNPGNMESRRAALYRWWRLLWHQGYDMTPFDSTANNLVFRGNTDPVAINAVTPGFGVLETIQAGGAHITEVPGTPEVATTETDWPNYHGIDGHQTGFTPDVGPSRGQVAWRYPVGHYWYARPVIEGGRVYAAGPGADVVAYCLDEVTGEVIWNARQYGLRYYHTTGTKWTPAVAGDRVMLTTGFWRPSNILVMDKTNGSTVLTLPAGDTSGGSTNDLAVYRRGRNKVILADARTGQGVWEFDAGGLLSGEPVLDHDTVYLARKTGQVYAVGPVNNRSLWRRETGGELWGPPSVSGGKVFVNDTSARTLHAIDAITGAALWTFPSPDAENKAHRYFSGAVESGGRVYVGAASGFLYCLDGSTGAFLWKEPVSDWIRSRPLAVDGTIYVATLDSQVYALRDDGASASVLWQRQVGEHGFAADLVGNAHGILANGRDIVLYSLSPETGYVQWRRGLLDQVWVDGEPHAAEVIGGQFMSSPTVVDGTLYIGGPDGFARALDADTGAERWRYETSGKVNATLTVAGDLVFIPQQSGNHDFHAVDKNTGEPVWTSDNFSWVFIGVGYAPAFDRDGDPSNDVGRIYVPAMDGRVHGVRASDGNVAWTSTASRGNGLYPHPVVDEAKVYTGGHDGYYRAWNQDTGAVEWSIQTGTGSGGDPDSAGMVMWQNRLYVQKGGTRIVALDRDTGAEVWQWSAPAGYLQNGVVAAFDDRIYGSAIRGSVELPYRSTIYAFNDVDNGGNLLWSYSTGGGGGGHTGPVAAPGKLIFGSTAGVFMTCLHPANGALKWRVYLGGAMEEAVPAIYGDKVYSLHRNGYLFAVQ